MNVPKRIDPCRMGALMKYVTIKKFSELSGYSEKAIQAKVQNGVWPEGAQFRKAPDGRIMVDCAAVERWVEGSRSMPVLRGRK